MTFTDNYEKFLSAMGTSQSLMWMAKAFDERFTTSEVGADGVLTWRWKLTWKWCKLPITHTGKGVTRSMKRE